MRIQKISTVLLAVTLVATSAWAGQFGDYKPQGFLSDYAQLKPEGGDSHAYVYRDPEADAAKYDKR